MPITRRQFIARTLGGGLGLGALAGGAGAMQAYAPAQLNVHRAALAGLTRPVRVAVLSDLHFGPLIGVSQVRGWISKALAARPDLILLVGDLLDASYSSRPADDDGAAASELTANEAAQPWENADLSAFLGELGRLRAPLGVYGAWGNHDYGSFARMAHEAGGNWRTDWPRFRASLFAELGRRSIHILRETGVLLRPDLYLGGVDDLWWGQPDPARALADAPVDAARLLMSHNPDVLMNLGADVLPPESGLMVSGHTHGGQVRLPFYGAPVVPSEYGQRFAQGWVAGQHGTRGFVSRGLGVSGVPLRSLCPSEVVLLDLRPPG